MPIRFSRAVVLGVLAALVGTVSAPAPASAAETLQVTLVAAVVSAEYGADVAFSATVTSNGVPMPQAFVELLRTGPDGVATGVDFAQADAAGVAALTDTARARATYVARAYSSDGEDSGTSAPVSLDVRYAVGPAVAPVAIPPGGRLSVAGTVEPVAAGVAVTVEERVGAGWRVLGTAPVGADGRWAFAVGTRSKVGTVTVRASVPGDAALSPGAAESSAVVTVTGSGKAAAWRPIAGTKANPARWGTCRIAYRVNERRMPADGLADLREAMRRVTQVSGIRFRYRGKSSVVPRPGYSGPGRNKIVVAWASPKQSGGLLYPGVGGVGGTSRSGSRLHSGYVLMNTQFSNTADPGFAQGSPHGLVLMHELGHVVGINHSPDRRQIMYGSSYLPAAVWGAADLRGLRKVGSHCR